MFDTHNFLNSIQRKVIVSQVLTFIWNVIANLPYWVWAFLFFFMVSIMMVSAIGHLPDPNLPETIYKLGGLPLKILIHFVLPAFLAYPFR